VSILLIIFLFVVLASMYSLEYISSVFRKVSTQHDNLTLVGYSSQSFLGTLSRTLSLLFTPIYAVLLDYNVFYNDSLAMSILYLIIPYFLLTLYYNEDLITKQITSFMIQSQYSGSLRFLLAPIYIRKLLYFIYIIIFKFPRISSINLVVSDLIATSITIINPQKSNQIQRVICNAFMPYLLFYICWPAIAILGTLFPANTAFILSLSSLLNGWNTFYNSLVLDPYLLMISDDSQASKQAYSMLLKTKLFASLSAAALLLFLSMIIYNYT